MLQVVAINGGVAESTDGYNWRLYVADERIVSHTGLSEVRYGVWNPKDGRVRSKVRGTSPTNLIEETGERLIAALRTCADQVPYPAADDYEYWLLDAAGGEPLALLESAIDEESRVGSATPRWHPGAAALREFASSGGSAEDLAAHILHTAGRNARGVWVRRNPDGDAETEDGTLLSARYFPELFLRLEWGDADHTQLSKDFVAWQAPWLLQLDNIGKENRAWLEQAAWQRPQETSRVFRLFPRVQDQEGLTTARVKAQLIGRPDTDKTLPEAFYPSCSD